MKKQEKRFNTMKIRSRKIAVTVAAAVVSAYSAAAQDMVSGMGGNAGSFYANGDAGVAILQNIIIRGSVIQPTVGPKVDVSAGYNIRQNIAVEIQGGFAHNDFSRVNGQPYPPGISVDIWTVPVMANGIYKYTFNNHWQAYGGLGAGVVISKLGVSEPPANGSETISPDYEFGYQAMLGIKYCFNDHLECGLGYTFLGSLDHHLNETFTPVPVPPFPGQQAKFSAKSSPTYMHSILVSLTYRF